MPRSCSVVKKELDDPDKIGPTFLLYLTVQPVARLARRWTRQDHVTKLSLGMAATAVFPMFFPLSHHCRKSCRKRGICAVGLQNSNCCLQLHYASITMLV
jgi:hypothetical protein